MKRTLLILFILGLSLEISAGFITVAPEYEERYEKLLSELQGRSNYQYGNTMQKPCLLIFAYKNIHQPNLTF